MKKIFALITALSLSGALAHTAVTSVTPALNASVSAPKSVQLKFSEPVELRFSTFRVMAMPAGMTGQAAATAALAEKADSAKVVSLPLERVSLAAQLTLPLKANLKAGSYVVAWKILSEDGHPVTGFSTFKVP
ncbi:copper resistance protein CopC [Deinococcus sp. Leaf326]|uniref:copper resistance CopC family protein n=1 Tax=Deinococcus sp. Leaf326 TaxID=1736338 RepID=UPI0006FB70FC|nr:copper resistance protein CopC [Deinococcus sp. Leaf326]KQR23009.1 copper resistance protein CopC [Deinococcus sp. Leaf326]